MYRTPLSLQEYETICARAEVSPNYHPRFAEYYFSRLKISPQFVGICDDNEIVAAFPVLYGQVFPSPVHKRLLGHRFQRIGEIGQPESLFPVASTAVPVELGRLSVVTSGLLAGKVRPFRSRSLMSVAIARDRRHKKLTIRQREFFASGGKALFTDQIDARDFAAIYLRLHSERWGYPIENLGGVRDQIIALYDHMFGVVLETGGEPVAVQLCYRAQSPTRHYVDFINSGVKLQDDNKISHGSVMMLTCLRRAEQDARLANRELRFSFGYYYGDQTYKAVWTQPEPTFIGY